MSPYTEGEDCFITNSSLRVFVVIVMMLALIAVLLVHYFLINLSSEVKLNINSLQKRSSYLPERTLLITFALATVFRTRNGSNGLDLLIAVVGLLYCSYQCSAKRTFMSLKLKYLYSIVYLAGLWLLLCYYIAKFLLDLGKPIVKPFSFFLVGLVILGIVSFFLRPRMKLKSVNLRMYGYNEAGKFLQNI